jgi:hypothetical protein
MKHVRSRQVIQKCERKLKTPLSNRIFDYLITRHLCGSKYLRENRLESSVLGFDRPYAELKMQ